MYQGINPLFDDSTILVMPAGGCRFWDHEVKGLHAERQRVSISFRLNVRVNKKLKRILIGRFPALSVSTARVKAKEVLLALCAPPARPPVTGPMANREHLKMDLSGHRKYPPATTAFPPEATEYVRTFDHYITYLRAEGLDVRKLEPLSKALWELLDGRKPPLLTPTRGRGPDNPELTGKPGRPGRTEQEWERLADTAVLLQVLIWGGMKPLRAAHKVCRDRRLKQAPETVLRWLDLAASLEAPPIVQTRVRGILASLEGGKRQQDAMLSQYEMMIRDWA